MFADVQLRTILDDLKKVQDCFNFTADSLGERALDVVAEGIVQAMDAQADPDGVPWPPLSDRYEEWKSAHFPGKPMAVLHEHMKQPDQVEGVRAITPTDAAMTYGLDERARQEASWFQDPPNPGQPPRPFYAIPIAIVPRLDRLFDDRFASILR